MKGSCLFKTVVSLSTAAAVVAGISISYTKCMWICNLTQERYEHWHSGVYPCSQHNQWDCFLWIRMWKKKQTVKMETQCKCGANGIKRLQGAVPANRALLCTSSMSVLGIRVWWKNQTNSEGLGTKVDCNIFLKMIWYLSYLMLQCNEIWRPTLF